MSVQRTWSPARRLTRGRVATSVGWTLLGVTLAAAALAPVLSPNDPSEPFADRGYAPPTAVHVHDAAGWHAPFIYRQVLADRLLRRFEADRTAVVPIRWWRGGRLFSVDPGSGPLLLFGADALGRDLFARLLAGARASLGVALVGAIGALLFGAAIGGLAGGTGGRTEALLMFVADFVLVLPAVYVVLVLRSMMALTLSWTTAFWLLATLFAVAGWPRVARGVRGIVAAERGRDYVMAARAAGAGPWRVVRHLLPAARGYLGVELVLIVPALLVAEVTLSYLGLGFPVPAASWGTMLEDTSNVRMVRDAPWLLAPAVALFVVVLAIQLVAGSRNETTMLGRERPGG